jgi:hypothetical protein
MTTFEELLVDPLLEKIKEVMNEHKNGDDLVFPKENQTIKLGDEHVTLLGEKGITKREYFAGLAMQALLSTMTIERDQHTKYISTTAVEYADALLFELSKERE